MQFAPRELWDSIRYSPWFRALPEWLREPPGLYIVAGAALFALVFFLIRYLSRRRGDGLSGQLKREIRQLRRAGDFLGVGQRYETLGNFRAALDAYRRGTLHAEYAGLLLRQGKREAAKRAAREGEVWVMYGDLCRDDEDFEEAGAAYEQAGKLYDAARAWETAGRALKAARCYAAVGMEYNAAKLLMKEKGPRAARALDEAIRSSLEQARGSAMSPDMVAAVRRGAQLWLAEGEPERAYALALDSEQLEIAVPIARDYVEPQPATAEVCLRAGAHLAAAEIYKKLGATRQEALARGEHFQRHDEAAEAGRWFEAAEAWSQAAGEWAAAGELEHAADLYARAEEFNEAAHLYDAAGIVSKKQAMQDAARAHDPRAVLEAEDETRQVRPHSPAAAPPAAAPHPTAPGGHLKDRYVLEEEIGRGGMGVVYRAFDTVLKRPVAYKMLTSDATGIVADPAALLDEARAAAKLSHPNIVQIHDAGQTGGGFFVVMELIDGEDFAHLLKHHRLSVPGVIAVGRQICAALDHAHKRRLVHRDLKPSNLMWTSEKQVKLTDFGLARFFEASVGNVVPTQAAGTPYYMAPEQIRGEAVDVRTDLYSFGCVIFELLCRRTPFSSEGSSIYHHLNSRPEDPRMSRQEVPDPLAKVILHCLEKDPAQRPGSAAWVGAKLAALASGSAATRPA